jgi:hypothetical protein
VNKSQIYENREGSYKNTDVMLLSFLVNMLSFINNIVF